MKFTPLLTLILALVMVSCDDLIERDLSGKSVTLLAPSNGVVSDINAQTFWWSEMDGALEYELQVVSTGFDSIIQLVVDTTVTATQFQQTLWPGQFQWRVRALNGSSESNYTTFSLTIDTATDLTGQTIVLVGPTNGSYSNGQEQDFSWQSLTIAEYYRLQISDDGFVSGANVLDTTITANTAEVNLGIEGEYSWRVRGETELSVSNYSTIWNVTIDTTAPQAVTLWLPENNASFSSQTFDFAWQTVSDNGSPIYDSLFVYSDSLVTLYEEYEGIQGSVSDSVAVGTYYWRVRSYDEAGNQGSYSGVRKFTVF